MHVRWDEGAAATPHGQLVFNARVPGRHRRYAHITALREDAVAAQALDRPWVLDIDASAKPLYGRQEGAEIGYNPTKPMRPSHVLHTFLVANPRLVLDAQVSCGKQHTSGQAKAALGWLLDELKNQWCLGGFTTHDIRSCRTMARSCALVYKWWSWYCRAAHPGGRLEAITSRLLLLAAVGKAASHANQTTLYQRPLHGSGRYPQAADCQHRCGLAAPQGRCGAVQNDGPWGCMLRYISERIAPVIGPPMPPLVLQATG